MLNLDKLVNNPIVNLLGDEVQYTPNGHASRPVKAVFTANAETVEAGAEVSVSTYQPQIEFQDSVLVDTEANTITPGDGDTVIVNGTAYRYESHDTDETGWTTVILHKRIGT